MEWFAEWFADEPQRGKTVLTVIALAVTTVIICLGRKRLSLAVPIALVFLFLAAVSIPSSIPARPAAYRNACIYNLGMIRDAKIQWAKANNKLAGDVPTEDDLCRTNGGIGFLRFRLTCPSGGIYTVGSMRQNPTCSRSDKGHRLE